MIILYGHPESGHTYKVAMSLALLGKPFQYRWVARIRALPVWLEPAKLLEKRA